MDDSQKHLLSEISQTQRTVYHLIPSAWPSGESKTVGTEIDQLLLGLEVKAGGCLSRDTKKLNDGDIRHCDYFCGYLTV